jgi:hypothetical protein
MIIHILIQLFLLIEYFPLKNLKWLKVLYIDLLKNK